MLEWWGMDGSVFLGIIFILTGVGLLALGVFSFFRQQATIAQSVRTEGVVVELLGRRVRNTYVWKQTAEGVNVEPKYHYRMVISFKTQAGRTVKFMPRISMRLAPYQIGDRVPVLYLPGQPGHAQVDRFIYLWFSVLMLLFFGFFSLGMGALIVVLSSL